MLLKDKNDDELAAFMEYAKPRKISVRFIELMPTADNADFFAERHLKSAAIVPPLLAAGWTERERAPGSGHARVFGHPQYKGTLGLIAPYEKNFCDHCNRLRVTSRGRLRLCLFAEGEFSLRPWLQRDEQSRELQKVVTDLVVKKEISHYLDQGRLGDTKHFASMGG